MINIVFVLFSFFICSVASAESTIVKDTIVEYKPRYINYQKQVPEEKKKLDSIEEKLNTILNRMPKPKAEVKTSWSKN